MPDGSGSDDIPAAVFVYGTLRPGRPNWPVAAPFCARHEPATLTGHGLYALAYPAIAPLRPDDPDPDHGGTGVHGELLWLEPGRRHEALDRLDAFEGVDPRQPARSYYVREPTVVVTEGGARQPAWVYLPGHLLRAEIDESRRVAGDDWPA